MDYKKTRNILNIPIDISDPNKDDDLIPPPSGVTMANFRISDS